MTAHGFPRPFQDPSERTLAGPVPVAFEAFYRSQLRYRSGARLRTVDVERRYAAWAAEVGASSMSIKAIGRSMLNIGHQRLRSNRTYFADVQLASEAPDQRDNFPALQMTPAKDVTLLSAIDRIEAELGKLRRAVSAGRSTHDR